MITPSQAESRLFNLSLDIQKATKTLVDCSMEYHTKDAELTIALAKSRVKSSHSDMKMTVAMRTDNALIENEHLFLAVALAEAKNKAAVAVVNEIKVQVDIARSISASIRNEMMSS